MVAPSASSLVASLSRATSTGHSSSDTSERMVQQQQGSSTRISSSPSSSRMITRSNRAKRSRAVMAAVASEAVVAGAAGGTETRVWKWRGYDIRYKVAGEVRESYYTNILYLVFIFDNTALIYKEVSCAVLVNSTSKIEQLLIGLLYYKYY